MLKALLIALILYTLFPCTIIKQGDFELIEGISSPHQVSWISNEEVLIVQEKDIFKYNILSKDLEKLGEREPNSFVSVNSKGELMFCEFEHFIIHSPEEFSTIFRIKDMDGNLIKEIKVFETIRPIYMDEEEIIAVTAMDFLEEHFFKINIESEKKEEIDSPYRKYSFDIPRYIDVRRVFVRSKDLYIIEDMNGNLILYNNLTSTKTMIPIFTAIFNPVPIKNPKNDAKPNLILFFKSCLAKIYSKSAAPKNAPMNTPKILPTIPPTIEPTTEPIVPYLDPPAFLVPSTAANSSAKVERMDMIRRITSVSGVMT